MKDLDLGILFFVQMTVLLISCRAFGWLFKKYLGQTQVVSEMAVGVILGPSVFGALAPHLQGWIFPQNYSVNGSSVKHPSMQIIYIVSQLGLVLYMFLIGLEFDLDLLKTKAKSAIAVSASGIITPFALGALLAIYLHTRPDCFGPNVGLGIAALYTGAAMSITAFPMLARIIFEKGIAKTQMGTLALTAGASDDALAWVLLAIVIAANKAQPMVAVVAILGAVMFGVAMVLLGKHVFTKFTAWTEKEKGVTPLIFGTVMSLLMLCACFTDAIGVYSVFGAFTLGAVLPRGLFADQIRGRLEMATVGVLLPTFFVYSGLNTKMGLLNTPQLWLITLFVLVFAMIGKGAACAIAAKVTGEKWRESIAIGVLMNARGLMGLIILSIGLQQGVITPTFFSIMVVMATVTTLMASPLFEKLYGRHVVKEVEQSNLALSTG